MGVTTSMFIHPVIERERGRKLVQKSLIQLQEGWLGSRRKTRMRERKMRRLQSDRDEGEKVRRQTRSKAMEIGKTD